MVGHKRVACPLQITVPILSRSVPLLSKSRDTDFPTPSTKTFQITYLGTKTFHIGSNTFQLLEPTLSKSYITVPKLSRSVPILSNSQYQNFPTHGTKTFQLFSWFLYPRLCKIVRKLVNCAKRCGKPLKVRISAENGRKCGKVRRMSKSAIPH